LTGRTLEDRRTQLSGDSDLRSFTALTTDRPLYNCFALFRLCFPWF